VTNAVSASRVVGLARQRRRLLASRAAIDDARVEVDHRAGTGVELRIMGGDTAHRRRRAPWHDAQLLPDVRPGVPQLLATLDPQHAGIRDVVRLHRAHVGAGERDAGAQRGERQERSCAAATAAQHATSRQASATSDDGHRGALVPSNAAIVDPLERERSRLARGDEESQVRIGGNPRREPRGEHGLAVVAAVSAVSTLRGICLPVSSVR
jgi:hypothetical protein